MREITNVIDALNDFKSSKDGTYKYKTHEPVDYSTGYQVSFVRPEAFEQLSDEEWDILTEYYCNYLKSDAHIGVYFGSTEVSFHSTDRLKAEETMKRFNQESMLDWAKKAEHPESITHWLIINQNYDESTVVDYHEILEKIQ